MEHVLLWGMASYGSCFLMGHVVIWGMSSLGHIVLGHDILWGMSSFQECFTASLTEAGLVRLVLRSFFFLFQSFDSAQHLCKGQNKINLGSCKGSLLPSENHCTSVVQQFDNPLSIITNFADLTFTPLVLVAIHTFVCSNKHGNTLIFACYFCMHL